MMAADGNADLTAVRIDGGRVPPAAAWADGLCVRLPTGIADLVSGCDWADSDLRRAVRKAADDLRLRRAFIERPPAASRSPVSYRIVPGVARRAIASVLGRFQRRRQSVWADFPAWPIDLSADFLADLAEPDIRPPNPTPVLLTHDIDSAEGLENLVGHFLDIEEAAGARSANFVVPCAWPLDHGLIAEASARGHEIGVHGYDHANRTPFASAPERNRRLQAGAALAAQYDAVGYRAPSLVRTRALLDALAPLYRYDSSIPTAGGLFPAPNNGCASARPWRIGSLWELPLSLPRDGSLRFLGHDAAGIARLWCETATLISRSGGVVNLLTHCERGFSGNAAMLGAYRTFVDWAAADSRFAFMRPIDLLGRLEMSGDEVRAVGH